MDRFVCCPCGSGTPRPPDNTFSKLCQSGCPLTFRAHSFHWDFTTQAWLIYHWPHRWAQSLGHMGLSRCRSCALEDSLDSCGARAQLLHHMWDFPRSGIRPMSPELADRFFTTEPPGSPSVSFYFFIFIFLINLIFFGLFLLKWLDFKSDEWKHFLANSYYKI